MTLFIPSLDIDKVFGRANRNLIKISLKKNLCGSIEEVDALAKQPNSVAVSAGMDLGMDMLLESIWAMMALVRVYTKKVRRPQHVGVASRIIIVSGLIIIYYTKFCNFIPDTFGAK